MLHPLDTPDINRLHSMLVVARERCARAHTAHARQDAGMLASCAVAMNSDGILAGEIADQQGDKPEDWGEDENINTTIELAHALANAINAYALEVVRLAMSAGLDMEF